MRLKSGVWVSAFIRRCASADVPVIVVRKGQADAGAIFIAVDLLDGSVNLYEPAPAGLDQTQSERCWIPCFEGAAVSEKTLNDFLARQAEFDPDLWLITIEDKQGRHFLGDALVLS